MFPLILSTNTWISCSEPSRPRYANGKWGCRIFWCSYLLEGQGSTKPFGHSPYPYLRYPVQCQPPFSREDYFKWNWHNQELVGWQTSFWHLSHHKKCWEMLQVLFLYLRQREGESRGETSLKPQDNTSTGTSCCFLAGNQFVLEIKCFPGVEEVRVWTEN